MLEGSLVEDIYIMRDNELNFINRNELTADQISYKIGNKYLHKINNITNTICISLHIYSPPNYKIKYYD